MSAAKVVKLADRALTQKVVKDPRASVLFFSMLPPIPIVLDIEVVCFADNPASGQSSALLGIHLPNEFRLAIVPVLQPGQSDMSAWESCE